MLNLERIHKSPVTLVKVTKNNNYLTYIPECILSSSPGAKIFSIVSEVELSLLESKKYITFISCKEIRKILFEEIKEKKDIVDFASVIIVNDIHNDTVEKLMIINLWKEIFKRTSTRPYLIITTISEITPEFSFQIKIDQTQDISESKDIEIEYYDTNFTPNSDNIEEHLYNVIISKNKRIPVEESKVWVVFYFKDKKLERKIYDSLKEEVNIFTSKSINKISSLEESNKRSIIFMDNNFLPSTFRESIDMVFDSIIYKINGNLTYSSKQNSDIRSSYIENGKIFRLCTYDYFQELPRVNIRDYDPNSLEKNYLIFIYYGIKVKNVFSNIQDSEDINQSLKKLESIGAISNNKITELGKMIIFLPLTTSNCDLVYTWIKDKNPIFPVVVAAVFSEIKASFYYGKNKFMDNVFEEYLLTFNKILKEVKNLDDINYSNIAKVHPVNIKIFKEVIEKIKSIVKFLKKSHKFKIGNYSVENLIKKLLPYYEKTHIMDFHTVVDSKNHLYRCRDTVSKLDFYKHHYDNKRIPKRILCFDKKRINEEKYSVQKGKNYIYFFLKIP